MYRGSYEKAIVEVETAIAVGGRSTINVGAAGVTYARAGDKAKAEECLAELQQRLEQGAGSYFWLARVCAALGETDRMFKWLEKAYDERDIQLYHIGGEPLFDSYRSDLRFKALLEKMGLEK